VKRDLAERVLVVTGAATGIGRGVARAAAAAGMKVVAADLDATALDDTVGQLRADGAEVLGVPTDVRDAGAVDALARAAVAAFGGVDVVCNNAGVWTLGHEWETSLEDWRWVVDVNLWGVVHGVRTFVPLLLGNPDGGHVVNVASMGGLVAGPLTGPYAATKHAVVGLSKSLRAELAGREPRVGVSVVCPGRVRTSILDTVNRRPEAGADRVLSPDAQAVLDAMDRAGASALEADAAGRQILDAVVHDLFWIFPGAGRSPSSPAQRHRRPPRDLPRAGWRIDPATLR
jgi:NAD(P)-dependent dehydrogenase (short-subunit alcohol dehydrogenase family)